MTSLVDSLARTYWLAARHIAHGGAHHETLAAVRAEAAQEQADMRTQRHDPIAVPLPHADRQRIAVILDPRDVIDDSPTCARAVGAEAYRRANVDSVATADPTHGAAQAVAMDEAKRRRAREIAHDVIGHLAGRLSPAQVADALINSLIADGVL